MKKEENTGGPRLTYAEREAKYAASRRAAVEKALKQEKVRYKSNRDPEKFKKFLEHRLMMWDDLKGKTFHGKDMYEKTSAILDFFSN